MWNFSIKINGLSALMSLPRGLLMGYLIAAFEIVWQTAMEHAQNHLCAQKEALELERQELSQAQKNSEKQSEDIKQHVNHLTQVLEQQKLENQKLKTELAVMQERFEKKEEAYIYAKKHDDTQLQHFLQEKNQLLQENQTLQSDLNQLQLKLINQVEDYQNRLEKQIQNHEQSENRWLKLIDNAKMEVKEVNKEIASYKTSKGKDLKLLKQKLDTLQQKQFEQTSQIKSYKEQVKQFEINKKQLLSENITLTLQVEKFKIEQANWQKNSMPAKKKRVTQSL